MGSQVETGSEQYMNHIAEIVDLLYHMQPDLGDQRIVDVEENPGETYTSICGRQICSCSGDPALLLIGRSCRTGKIEEIQVVSRKGCCVGSFIEGSGYNLRFERFGGNVYLDMEAELFLSPPPDKCLYTQCVVLQLYSIPDEIGMELVVKPSANQCLREGDWLVLDLLKPNDLYTGGLHHRSVREPIDLEILDSLGIEFKIRYHPKFRLVTVEIEEKFAKRSTILGLILEPTLGKDDQPEPYSYAH